MHIAYLSLESITKQFYNHQDFVLDWEHELPETDLSLSDSHSVLADLSIVMGSTLQIIPAGVKTKL